MYRMSQNVMHATMADEACMLHAEPHCKWYRSGRCLLVVTLIDMLPTMSCICIVCALHI